MAAFAGAAPMPPPEIREQQQPPAPVMMQAGNAMEGEPPGGGASASDPVGMLEQKIKELEKWASETMMLVEQVHKPAGALLVPIAKAGQALKAEIEQLKQRKGGGGSAAAGGRAPKPNPAEGAIPPQQAA